METKAALLAATKISHDMTPEVACHAWSSLSRTAAACPQDLQPLGFAFARRTKRFACVVQCDRVFWFFHCWWWRNPDEGADGTTGENISTPRGWRWSDSSL